MSTEQMPEIKKDTCPANKEALITDRELQS